MDEILARIGENLVGRLTGPLTLRLYLQPLMAGVLAIKSGLADARSGRPAFFWAILSNPAERPALVRDAWTSIAKVFSLAVLLDGIYQLVALRWFYPGEAVLVAIILAIVPYVALRGPINRLVRAARPPVNEVSGR